MGENIKVFLKGEKMGDCGLVSTGSEQRENGVIL
jgi:hypothetical protein